MASSNTNLANSLPVLSGGKVAAGSANSGTFSSAVTDLLKHRNATTYNTTRPMAYLNRILLEKPFNEVITNDVKSSGFGQAGADNVFTPHNRPGVELTLSGYLYVYVSNESTDISVYFDNLQVTQVRGRLLKETHYYPFGLTIAGFSIMAATSLTNKYLYNGKELQE